MLRDETRKLVEDAVSSFAQARREIELTFAVTSAAELVSAVLKERIARDGHTLNGLMYFVHGIGYTVVFPSEGQVHLDSGERGEGDVFSAYDIRFYLETAGYEEPPTVEAIKSALIDMHSGGSIRRFGNRFGAGSLA